MSPELIAIIAAAVMILGFLWNLHRDIAGMHLGGADMRGRMVRLEGLFEGFTRREPPRRPHSGAPISEPPFAGRESTRSH